MRTTTAKENAEQIRASCFTNWNRGDALIRPKHQRIWIRLIEYGLSGSNNFFRVGSIVEFGGNMLFAPFKLNGGYLD